MREADGLALSSRNKYLDAAQRKHASVLHQALQEARELAEKGERDPSTLMRHVESRIGRTPGAALDYVAVVDADTFQPAREVRGTMLILVAVRLGSTRLIDNLALLA